MTAYHRYAIYVTPPPGPLADFGAAWLGWDALTGRERVHPDLPGLPAPVAELTATPRKYGLHATLKAPFALAQGCTVGALHSALETLAAQCAPVVLTGLALETLGDFLALTPTGDTVRLNALAARVVKTLDPLRAPMTPTDRARRLKTPLTPCQIALLDQWGYPYVLEQFRFHITLTGALSSGDLRATRDALAPVLAEMLPSPYRITRLSLSGEASDGRFHVLHHYELNG